MKVGIFAGSSIPESGGAFTFENQLLVALLESASDSHHTFTLITYSQKSVWEKLYPSIQIISLHRSLQQRLVAKCTRTVYAILNKLRNSSSQLNLNEDQKFIIRTLMTNKVNIVWSLSSYCLTTEIPYITTVWDLQHRLQPYFPETSSNGQWDAREQFYSRMLRRASCVITGTEVGKSEIREFYQVPDERIRVLPFPTPHFESSITSQNTQKILEKYKIPHNYLFYPAQFWPHKNHIGLLLAIKCLCDEHNLTFPVVFVGSDKGNQAYVKQVTAELNLSKQVYFLGFVPQEDLIALYQQAFALIFLTFFGPDNLPPLEAMALGCPVIASKIVGAQEQLGDRALLVDPKDPKQIASAIKNLWEDTDLRQTLIERGLKRANQWTARDYIKGIFPIFDDFETIQRCWI